MYSWEPQFVTDIQNTRNGQKP